jgi:hypothetical protein
MAAQEDGLIAMGLITGLRVSPPHTGIKTDWNRMMGPGVIDFLATDGKRKHGSHPFGAKLVGVERSSKDVEGCGKSGSASLNQIPVLCETAFVPMQVSPLPLSVTSPFAADPFEHSRSVVCLQDQWFQYELIDAMVCPSHYEIRVPPYDKAEDFGNNHLRVWRLEASKDGVNFVIVCEHRLSTDVEGSLIVRDGGEFGTIRWRPQLGCRFDISEARREMGDMTPMMPSYGLGVVTLKGETAKLEGGKVVDTLSSVDWEAEMKAVHPETAMKKQQAAPSVLSGKAADYDPSAFYSVFRVVAKDQVGLAGFEVYGILIKRTGENLKVAEQFGQQFNV